jgi:hypothetical protein
MADVFGAGESVAALGAEGGPGGIFTAPGESAAALGGEGAHACILTAPGEAAFVFGAESLVYQKLAAASGPHIYIDHNPQIGGGLVITFDAQEPGAVTFWEMKGYDPVTGWEEAPHGFLWDIIVKADSTGRAVNRYIAPKDNSQAGKTDRVIVRKISVS